jgi:Tfp pilus assembly protein PilP
MRSAITLGLGILIAAAAPGLWAQANPPTPQSAKPAPGAAAKPTPQAAKPAPPAAPAATKPAPQAGKSVPQPAKPVPAATKPAPQAAKPADKAAGKAATKPVAKAAAKPAVKRAPKKAVEKPSTPGTKPAAAESEIKQARRDPFESLIGRQNKAPANLPPGKLGLQVSTLRLDGIVRSPNGMIAVVSNPQARTYFLREGDRLFDGSVEKISMDGVSFHEEGKDAFGKPVEHQVNKRIYSSPGEQQ